MAEKLNVQAKPEKPVIGPKLEQRKKQGTITLVTPPSFFQNQNRSFCLINLSKKDKDNFADAVNKWFPKDDLTIYLWDDNNFSALDPFGQDSDPEYEKYLETWKPNKGGRDYTWLLNACRAASTIVIALQYYPDVVQWDAFFRPPRTICACDQERRLKRSINTKVRAETDGRRNENTPTTTRHDAGQSSYSCSQVKPVC